MKKITLTISFLLVVLSIKAQFNFIEHYNNKFALGNSLEINNQGIHVVGTTGLDIGNNQFAPVAFLSTYNLQGQLQFYQHIGDTGRVYEGEKLLIDSNGNKYILGDFKYDSLGNLTNQGIFVQKRDSNNQILWTTEYQDSVTSSFYFTRSGAILSNGNIALCGAYNLGSYIVPGVPDQDILYLVFDSIGQCITKKRIGGNLAQEEARSMTVYDKNRLALGAQKNFPGADGKNWVLMLDYQGNILDEYLSVSNRRVGVWDIVKTKDGGLACASATSEPNFDQTKSFVEKLDSNLNQVWEYTIDSAFRSGNLATAIVETPNGDIIVGGNVIDFLFEPDTAGSYAFLMKFSAIGDSIWHKGYYYYNNINLMETHTLFDVTIHNNDIYFVGDANDFNNPIPPGQSMWLVSTDSNGVVSSFNEAFVKEGIRIYPNPTKGQIRLSSRSRPAENTKVEIYNLQGHKVLSARVDLEIGLIDVTELPPSMYIMRVYSGDQVHSLKFVKE